MESSGERRRKLRMRMRPVCVRAEGEARFEKKRKPIPSGRINTFFLFMKIRLSGHARVHAAKERESNTSTPRHWQCGPEPSEIVTLKSIHFESLKAAHSLVYWQL